MRYFCVFKDIYSSIGPDIADKGHKSIGYSVRDIQPCNQHLKC